MLAKCANPACFTRFRYLESGTLFRLESDPRLSSGGVFREYFWLCRGCSSKLKLRLDETGTVCVSDTDDGAQRGNEVGDLVLLDRQNGMLLSRISLFQHRGRRHEKPERGQVRL